MKKSESCPQKRKVIRKLKPGQSPNCSQWSLVEWMLARLPISPRDDLDAVVYGVITEWTAHVGRGQVLRKASAEDRAALVDILVGASMRADGHHFSRKGLEHYKGSRVLQGWFMQHMHMPGGQSDCIRALVAVEGVTL